MLVGIALDEEASRLTTVQTFVTDGCRECNNVESTTMPNATISDSKDQSKKRPVLFPRSDPPPAVLRRPPDRTTPSKASTKQLRRSARGRSGCRSSSLRTRCVEQASSRSGDADESSAEQIKLTNVSVVRLRKGGKRFEIACYKNKVRRADESELRAQHL